MPDVSAIFSAFLGVLYDWAGALINGLDIDPFPGLIASIPSPGSNVFGGLVGWFVPLGDFERIIDIWLGMMLLAWFIMLVWRWVKAAK